MGSPVGLFRENLCFGPFGTVVREAAVVQRSQPVNHVHSIPCPGSQHAFGAAKLQGLGETEGEGLCRRVLGYSVPG